MDKETRDRAAGSHEAALLELKPHSAGSVADVVLISDALDRRRLRAVLVLIIDDQTHCSLSHISMKLSLLPALYHRVAGFGLQDSWGGSPSESCV